jgi:dTDP-4-amino-4,6-dideoxy-D-galactose acyltransferase
MGGERLSYRASALAGLVPALAVPRLARRPGLADEMVAVRWQQFGSHTNEHRLLINDVEFLYIDLPWDSQFFGRPMARLLAVLFGPKQSVAGLTQAVREFGAAIVAAGIQHCYCEIAAADALLLYAIGSAGWGMVETRLHYYQDNLDTISEQRRSVRTARPEEAELIAGISTANRNPHDRFHADPAFGPVLADAFLGEYAREAVCGYCDEVLVPNQSIVDSFLAVSFQEAEARAVGLGLGRVVLTAVGPQNRGWHRPLVAETLYRVRERGGKIVFMTTQPANAAVVHNAQCLGFKLGGITQLFSIMLPLY